MRYCQGKCRKKMIDSRGRQSACRYFRSYIVTDSSIGSDPFEICFKPTFGENIIRFFINLFFNGALNANDLGTNGRKSETVERNRSR